jgi:hypothetical protein
MRPTSQLKATLKPPQSLGSRKRFWDMEGEEGHSTRRSSHILELSRAKRRLQMRTHGLVFGEFCALTLTGDSGTGNGRAREPRKPRLLSISRN